MNRARRDLFCLLLLALLVRLTIAGLISRPGYMDAAYYAAGAVRLAEGGGLSERFIWNYLDDPAGLPHPGFLYWMPLPSLLAAVPAALFPGAFFALQFPFALLSGLLPLVAYLLAWEATGHRRTAWLAGLFTLFSGFFFPYWTLPETFAPFALFGSLALWLAGRRKPIVGLGVGLLVGLAHLSRADGVLLLAVVAVAPLLSSESRGREHVSRLIVSHLSFIVLGYLLVMGPWFVRNLGVVGEPLSSAGAKTVWLTSYDDLFCYQCDLSLGSYLAWGWGNILGSKLWALGVNLQRFLAEDCLVFLLPFVLIGLYRLRRRSSFALASTYLVLVYVAHSLAFTFPGPRGGFFHASAAALPFLLAAGAEGLRAAVGWAAGRRRWDREQAQVVFAAAAVIGAVLLSLCAAAEKLPAWRDADAVYVQVGRWLRQRGGERATVLVANPPAFWYHTEHPAVVVPNGNAETLLAVADRYGVEWVILDENRPSPLAGLYAAEAADERLEAATNFGAAVIYRVRR